jgi:tetratricopeptide (TPR) repeat protein
MNQSPNKNYTFLICLVIALITFIAFTPLLQNQFVDYDDNAYLVENPHVQSGITLRSIVWAFTTTHMGNWHPLTWLNYMVDWKLFGPNARWHHLESLVFHTANALLLFLVLKRMTGAIWQSAFVAAAFALHPLHVESVAWAAERKDVLSTFFWLLTMWAYVLYVEKPKAGRYLLVALSLCLGLMAKPMLVTLPFVLLLLDYWPLQRFQRPSKGNGLKIPQDNRGKTILYLILEKIPLFLLVILFSLVTFFAQQSKGAVESFDRLIIESRINNALVSYAAYITKMFWPARLAVFYPHPRYGLPIWKTVVASLLLASITLLVIRRAQRQRWFLVGWLWYLGTLVPVIGLIQVGAQAMANRYTYVPIIGLFIIAAWQIPELITKWPHKKIILKASTVVIVSAMMICTWRQTGYWQNCFTLSSYAIKVTTGNYVAHTMLGSALHKQGNFEDAICHYKESLRLRPNHANTEGDIGLALLNLGRLDEAALQFRKALMLKGDMQKWHSGLAIALDKLGRLDEAIEHYRQALELKSDDPTMHEQLATALCRKGNFEEAIKDYEDWLRLNPNQAEIVKNMGNIYLMAGKTKQAIDYWAKAVELKPDFSEALNNLAWMLSTTKDNNLRNLSDAVKYAQRACELTDYKQAELLDTLAVTYAAVGSFPEAIETAEKAIELAKAAGKKDLAEEIRKRLELYKAGQPYHEK